MNDSFEEMSRRTQEIGREALEEEFNTKEHIIPEDMLKRFHSLGGRTVDELTEEEINYLVNGIGPSPETKTN